MDHKNPEDGTRSAELGETLEDKYQRQQQAYQVQLRHLLDTHLVPFLKEEWMNTLSIYEAGAQPTANGEGLDRVVLWMRSEDIVTHTDSLLKHFIVDPVERIPGVGTGEPRCDENTLRVRLHKKADETDLVVTLFQVFGEGESDDELLSKLQETCEKKNRLPN